MSLASGDLFAGYEVQRMLGAGGMGEVYLVRHPRLPRLYALKTLSASLTDDEEFRRRFIREAELAAELSHPHIVGVHDRGEFEGRLWIAMDYVEGVDASKLMRDRYSGGMPESEVVEIISAVGDALDYAHSRLLMHRDVKPANILLDDTVPGRRRILLADFGVARKTDDVSGLTATNTTIGSVAYAAPEQLMGQKLDGRADQYALAATAFHLLTGQPPFANSNPAVVISGHLSIPPPPLAQTHPGLARFDPVLSKGMAKTPDGRYPTCREFAEALAACVNASAPPPPPPPPPPVWAAPPLSPPASTTPPPPQVTPAYLSAPIDYATQATASGPPTQQWQQPQSTQSSSMRNVWVIVALVAVFAIVLLAVGSYVVVQLMSAESTPTTTPSASTRASTSSAEPTTSRTQSSTATTTTPTTTPASPTSPPGTTTMSGIGKNQTIACTDNVVEISGIENTATITGHCLKLTVSGQGNKIIVDSTDAIAISGIGNAITYHSGNPSIDRSGLENTVGQG